jgi:uncharacterized protein involved in tolerance to divalent cations
VRKLCYLLLTYDNNEKENIANANEVALLMESAEDLFDEIESEVRKVHGYDMFVLTQLLLSNINQSAKDWMQQELKGAR